MLSNTTQLVGRHIWIRIWGEGATGLPFLRHLRVHWIQMWALAAFPKGRCAPQGLCPQAVSGTAQFSELHGLDLPTEEVGTEGLTQPVSRGQRAAQGTTHSERNQTEVLATLTFKDPVWPMWQSKDINLSIGSLPGSRNINRIN